ncbi:hypothetical protein HMPREF0043_01765 [Actinobaculum sp. oral taxon 183 str. F0552]|jgi:hypothetical protein|nr:hypothetical protein HMPREF0043_01765 [Actinobaculum sp. oral taxon 183 str. F0552]
MSPQDSASLPLGGGLHGECGRGRRPRSTGGESRVGSVEAADGFVGESARSAAVPAYAGKWLTLRFAGASGWGSGPRYGSGGHCGHVSVRTLARLVRIAVPG